MKPTRRAAWFAPGGNASYFPALLFARVGAEDPRYPRSLPWLPPLGEPGAFFGLAATICALEHFCIRLTLPVSLPGLTGQSSIPWSVVTGSPGQAGR